jgi:outer membrane protein OmpA-like peptidoglycan-associated protein
MSMLGADGLGNLAGGLGASEQAVSGGIASSVASMIGGLAKHADNPSFMRQVFDLVSNVRSDINVSSLASAALSSGSAAPAVAPVMDTGKKFLSMIFGDQQNAVNETLGRASGLGGSAMRQLMVFAAPLLLSVLGRRVREGGLTTSSFRSDLLGQAAGINHLLPTGLGNVFADAPRPAATAVVQDAAPLLPRWLWPVGAAALALIGLFWAINRYNNRSVAEQASNALAATGEAARSRVAGLGEFISRKLPNNVDLHIPEYGVEGRLLSFIQSSPKVSSDTWFDFDRLSFDTNSATLRPESQEQLQNIAAILKAYPNVRVKIGGYTDSTGNPDTNRKLSEDRASSVVAELTRLGISGDRLEAQGYGAEHPIGDNATEEGRAMNRRISIRVTGA